MTDATGIDREFLKRLRRLRERLSSVVLARLTFFLSTHPTYHIHTLFVEQTNIPYRDTEVPVKHRQSPVTGVSHRLEYSIYFIIEYIVLASPPLVAQRTTSFHQPHNPESASLWLCRLIHTCHNNPTHVL
jgi:hypothetical protein